MRNFRILEVIFQELGPKLELSLSKAKFFTTVKVALRRKFIAFSAHIRQGDLMSMTQNSTLRIQNKGSKKKENTRTINETENTNNRERHQSQKKPKLTWKDKQSQ